MSPAGQVHPHQVIRLASGVDPIVAVHSLEDGLLLARVDGERMAADVCMGGPYDALDALLCLQRLAGEGAIDPVREEEDEGPDLTFFDLDLDDPPPDALTMVPRPTYAGDAETPTESGDYFLYLQVDGNTDVAHLAAIWGRPVSATLGGLIEFFHRGLASFPESFLDRYLVGGGRDQPASEGLDPTSEALFESLGDDDFFYAAFGPLIPAIDTDADMSRVEVGRTQGFPLALVDGRHTASEICDLSARSRAETVGFLLYLFHVGLVKLLPAEEEEEEEPAAADSSPGVDTVPVTPPEPEPEARAPTPAPTPSTPPAAEDDFLDMEWSDEDESGYESQPIVTPPPDMRDSQRLFDSQPIVTPPPDAGGAAPSPYDSQRLHDSQPIVTPPPDVGGAAPSPYDSQRISDSQPIVTPPPDAGGAGPSPYDSQRLSDSQPILTPPPAESYVLPPWVVRDETVPGGPAADVLREQAAAGLTGRIEVQMPDGRRTLWLEGGRLVGARSDASREDLGLYLFQAGVLAPEAFGVLEAERRITGNDPVTVLREKGLLAPDALQAQAAGLDAAIVRAVAEAPDARCEVMAGDLPQDLLDNPQDLLDLVGSEDAAARGGTFTKPYVDVPSGAYRALLDDHAGYYVVVRQEEPPPFDDREVELFGYLAATPRRLAAALANSPLGRTKTQRFLYALYCEGRCAFDPSPGLQLRPEYDLEDLEDELERQSEADLFRRLGLHFTATGPEVEGAFTRLATHFDSARVAGDSPEAAPMVRQIRAKVDEAFARLAEEGARRDYREERLGPTRIAFHAEVECRRGVQLLHQGRDKEALEAFSRAYDLKPDEPAYMAYRGLAEAGAGKNDPAHRQRGWMAVERALALAPEEARVAAVAAAFHRDHGEESVARQHAERARSLASGEPGSKPFLRALGL